VCRGGHRPAPEAPFGARWGPAGRRCSVVGFCVDRRSPDRSGAPLATRVSRRRDADRPLGRILESERAVPSDPAGRAGLRRSRANDPHRTARANSPIITPVPRGRRVLYRRLDGKPCGCMRGIVCREDAASGCADCPEQIAASALSRRLGRSPTGPGRWRTPHRLARRLGS
jgi:hypothetical protein